MSTALVVRKKRKVSTALTKKIKSIVYKTVNRSLETKRAGYNNQATFFDAFLRVSNVIYPIPQGDNGASRDGAEIQLKGITVRNACAHALNENVTFHCAIVASDAQYSGIMSTGTIGDFFANISSHPNNWRFDTDRCDVLGYRKVKTMGGYYFNAAERNAHMKFNVKFNRKLIWNDQTSYLNGKNIYVIYWTAIPNGGLQSATISSDVTVYFKA